MRGSTEYISVLGKSKTRPENKIMFRGEVEKQTNNAKRRTKVLTQILSETMHQLRCILPHAVLIQFFSILIQDNSLSGSNYL
jgi:hypothetical protein